MRTRSFILIFLIISLLPIPPASAIEKCPSFLEDPEAVQRLKRGKLVILLRHTATVLKESDGGKQCKESDRLLSPAGVVQATDIGAAIKARGIPIDVVMYSPTCRTQQTAEIVFSGERLIAEPRLIIIDRQRYPQQHRATQKWLNDRLTLVPERGNVFLVTHGTVMSELRVNGKPVLDGYSEGDGLAAIFDPADSSLLGCLTRTDWGRLKQ